MTNSKNGSHQLPDVAVSERDAQLTQGVALTVHASPRVDMQQSQTRAGRLKMLMVLLACAAPVIASYWMYYVVKPQGRKNFGVLIEPQREMPAWQVLKQPIASVYEKNTPNASSPKRADFVPMELQKLRDQWLLVSVSGAMCDVRCENNLYLQRQLRTSLGKEKERLDWVWLITDDAPISERAYSLLNQTLVLRLTREQRQNLPKWLPPDNANAEVAQHLYVIDPMGNAMMRFPASLGLNAQGQLSESGRPNDRVNLAQAAKAKRDLERLLRASSSWDQAGRQHYQ